MDLENSIRTELWNAVEESYSNQDYTAAILDAISLVTDTLRDKTGLDGDGEELVGKALGFSKDKPPLLAVNKLQTQTERDIQVGLRETLKGIYSLIRNPRSHERYEDKQKTADAIILFADYLLSFLGESQQSFTPEGFLLGVTDPYFALDDEYVAGLVATIPVRKLYDTLVTVYRNKFWAKSDNYALVIKVILKKIDERQVSDFLQVVSNDLQQTTNEVEIVLIIKVLPAELWQRLDSLPRIRIENELLTTLRDATYDPETKKTNSATSTWIAVLARQFHTKDKLRIVILAKLRNEDFNHHDFIANYLIDRFPDIFEGEQNVRICARALAGALRRGNYFLKERIVAFIKNGPPQDWIDEFASAFEEFTDPDKPEIYTPDGVPLFGRFTARANPHPAPEEEIPF